MRTVRRLRRPVAPRPPRRDGNPLAEAGLRLLLQQNPALVWSTDRGLRVTEVLGDPAAARVRTIQELFAGGDDAEAIRAHRRALAGDSVSLQAIVRGSVSTVRLEPLRGAAGERIGVVGAAVAIDPASVPAPEAGEAEQRLFALVDHLPAAVYTKPVDGPWGRYRSISPQISAILGYPAEQWLHDETLVDRVIHPDDYDRVRAGSDRLRATGEPFSLEYRLIASDGRIVQAHDATVLVRGSDGRGDYLHGMLVEAASREAVEEQFRTARSAQVLGRFAGGIVHDFRNSLCAIGGYAALLERELATTPKLRPWASEIVRTTERATDFTSRLIEFSRGSASSPERVDLCRNIDEFARMYRPLVGPHVTIHVDQPAEPVDVVVDPVELERVLMNLGTNAWDAMPEGGTLTFTIRTDGPRARLSIEDTGCGLDEASLGKIFDPFFTTKPTGTGLGLATVLDVVRGWGGDVTVTSTVGAGTRFELTLPLAAGAGGQTVDRGDDGGACDSEDRVARRPTRTGPVCAPVPPMTGLMPWMNGRLAPSDPLAA